MNKLTAEQIKFADELQRDKQALNETLEVALNYHANKMNELKKSENEFWEGMCDQFDLDRSKVYKIKKINGAVVVDEKDETD